MDLKTAIQIVADEYIKSVVPHDQIGDPTIPGEAVYDARGALTVEELESWNDARLAEAYRAVLVASADELHQALA